LDTGNKWKNLLIYFINSTGIIFLDLGAIPILTRNRNLLLVFLTLPSKTYESSLWLVIGKFAMCGNKQT
jgi:hypothetical protein